MNETDSFNAHAAKAMRTAFESSKRGALISESGDAKRLVFFEEGELVGARSNLPEERLGSVMVRMQQITEAELEHAISFTRTGRKLGQILVELGYLPGGAIENFIRIQVLDIASAILLSSSDRLVFSEQIEVEAVTLSPISIGDVFLAAVKRLPNVQLYRENVLVEDYVLTQTPEALALASGMSLSSEEATLLDLVDANRSVREILTASPLGDDETIRTLIALHQSGALALKERRAAPPVEVPAVPAVSSTVDPFEKELIRLHNEIQCQNHWQVLGLDRGAGYEQIEEAYRTLYHKFAPEPWAHIQDADFHEKLSFVRSRVKEAYITLSSQTSTNVYEKLEERDDQYQETREQWEVIEPEPTISEATVPDQDPEEAKRLFKRAKRAMHEQDFWNAIELCRRSIELDNEQDPDRYHLLGRALGENPRWRLDAERNLKIAQKLKPWEPRYLVSLGQLYRREGLYERAERVFDQIRTMDPDFPIPKMLEADATVSPKPTAKTDAKQKAG